MVRVVFFGASLIIDGFGTLNVDAIANAKTLKGDGDDLMRFADLVRFFKRLITCFAQLYLVKLKTRARSLNVDAVRVIFHRHGEPMFAICWHGALEQRGVVGQQHRDDRFTERLSQRLGERLCVEFWMGVGRFRVDVLDVHGARDIRNLVKGHLTLWCALADDGFDGVWDGGHRRCLDRLCGCLC